MTDSFKYQKYFVKSAPYGELPDVLANLNKLSHVDEDAEQFQETLQEYNE